MPYFNNLFDFILQGDEATEENAIFCAQDGSIFMECETSSQNIGYADYIDTVNGVGIYYDYGADYYFFTDETGNDDD